MAARSMQPDPSARLTVNRLPLSKRNTPQPATIRKKGPVVQVGEDSGEVVSVLKLRNVNDPRVPFPAKSSSSVTVSGCRLITLAPKVPENLIFMGFSCA